MYSVTPRAMPDLARFYLALVKVASKVLVIAGKTNGASIVFTVSSYDISSGVW